MDLERKEGWCRGEMVKKTTIDGQVDFIMHRRYVLFAAGSSATQSTYMVSIDTLSFGQAESITSFDTHPRATSVNDPIFFF
jgi:hypothetical protein